MKHHRAQIRAFLNVREPTVEDGEALATWLRVQVVPQERNLHHLKVAAYARLRALHIEPPAPKRLERIVRSAVHSYEEGFYTATIAAVPLACRVYLDGLLTVEDTIETGGAVPPTPERRRSLFHYLRREPGPVNLESILQESSKLQQLREIGLPRQLFTDLPRTVIQQYRERVVTEPPREVRRHPDSVRYTLLAAFCWLRSQEITDSLTDLLIDTIHRIGVKAEKRVDRVLLQDLKCVRGKTGLLYAVAEAALEQPNGIVCDVVYPAAGGAQTLRDLVREYKTTGAYDRQVQMTMRGSYSQHYRRMVPAILDVLDFRSNNKQHRPVIQALSLLKTYADREQPCYSETDDVPIEREVPRAWRSLVQQRTKRGAVRINRINYELCVLHALREKLRCKEIWVDGAFRYRNPDLDLPQDFEAQRVAYYMALNQPLAADDFIASLQHEMTDALAMLSRGLPHNLPSRSSLPKKAESPSHPLSRSPSPSILSG